MTPEQAAALRAPFPPEAIGKIPKAGTTLDYVGHAAVTDRLLQVDPAWSWEPAEGNGEPRITQRGNDSVMWIRLRVKDVTRLGVGIVATKSFELEKQLISDAIRNAAMRFGVALDLWSKEDLRAHDESSPPSHGESAGAGVASSSLPAPDAAPAISKNRLGQLTQRLRDKRAAGASFDFIARELSSEGIEVSGETVRTWCAELDIDPAPAADTQAAS